MKEGTTSKAFRFFSLSFVDGEERKIRPNTWSQGRLHCFICSVAFLEKKGNRTGKILTFPEMKGRDPNHCRACEHILKLSTKILFDKTVHIRAHATVSKLLRTAVTMGIPEHI